MHSDRADLRATPKQKAHVRVSWPFGKADRDIATLLGLHLPKATTRQRALAHVGILDLLVKAAKGKL